ncbi:HAD family hydrolase [Capnocytophaga canimorsus]|nr:HAD family phosphatase [Capnocytophaga canimorsus]
MKHLIFDMDGVLIDSEPVHKNILNGVFKALGMHITSSYLESLTGMAAIPTWTKIKEDMQREETPEQLVAFHRDYFYQRFEQFEIPEVKGVKQLISRLKKQNVCLSVASSSSKELINIFTQKLDIQRYFDVMVSGNEVEKSKPNPDIFLKVAQWYGAAPEHFWVIEDSKHGVEAAKSAGMKCIGFANANSGNQDLSKADVIVREMDEITDFFIEQMYR